MTKAIGRVKPDESCYAVWKATGISYETIRRNGLYQMKKNGALKVASDVEEILLKHLIIYLSEGGLPLDRKNF